jgi:hypothetical protein
MNTRITRAALLGAILAAGSCSTSPALEPGLQKVDVKVTGMT